MATVPTLAPGPRASPPGDDLLLRELQHRCANDLQLVLGMLALQIGRSGSAEARSALGEAMDRVAILARTRGALHGPGRQTLEMVLAQVCEALHSQAEPRGVRVTLDAAAPGHGLSQGQVMSLSLAVNELVTNAIKHAFAERAGGHVAVALRQDDHRLVIAVDDDGLPLPGAEPGGQGLSLVKRLVASAGGLLIPPAGDAKRFEIRIPDASR